MGAALGPADERMLSESRARRPRAMTLREELTEASSGVLLALIVLAIALSFHSEHELNLGVAAALTAALAVAARVRFSVGPGFTTPIQLVLIPMLFTLPPAAVPLAATLGYTLSKLPEVLRGA